MSHAKQEAKEFDMDLFLKMGPVEFTYYMTGIKDTGPYRLKDYFTPASLELISECEGMWIQHVSNDTLYMVDIDYNVWEYPYHGELIRAEQLVQMGSFPLAEPKCLHALKHSYINATDPALDFLVCGEYVVFKSTIDIKAVAERCASWGYPISIRKADGVYIVTDKTAEPETR